jgi:hypothetical protein
MKNFLTFKLEKRNNIFAGKSEWKKSLGKPRRRWENNNRIEVREIGWEDVDWMHLAQDRNQ